PGEVGTGRGALRLQVQPDRAGTADLHSVHPVRHGRGDVAGSESRWRSGDIPRVVAAHHAALRSRVSMAVLVEDELYYPHQLLAPALDVPVNRDGSANVPIRQGVVNDGLRSKALPGIALSLFSHAVLLSPRNNEGYFLSKGSSVTWRNRAVLLSTRSPSA